MFIGYKRVERVIGGLFMWVMVRGYRKDPKVRSTTWGFSRETISKSGLMRCGVMAQALAYRETWYTGEIHSVRFRAHGWYFIWLGLCLFNPCLFKAFVFAFDAFGLNNEELSRASDLGQACNVNQFKCENKQLSPKTGPLKKCILVT